MQQLRTTRACLALALVAVACSAAEGTADDASAANPGSPEERREGTTPGGPTDPPTSRERPPQGPPWQPPTTGGPPATCTSVSGSFGGLAMTKCTPAGGEGKTGKPAPLVLALHGFTQTAKAYEDTTEWHVLGGRYGFYVVYPFAPGSRSWTWFSGDRARDRGDGASIVAMVERMKAEHDIRADMVFVTGLSAGGYQTLVLLADYPDVFAAGAAMAGGPFGCDMGCMGSGRGDAAAVRAAFPSFWNDPSKPKPRLLLVQGDKDNIVSPTNLTQAAKQWIEATGAQPSAANAQLGLPEQLKGYPYAVYSRDGAEATVATLSVTGMGHGTPVEPGSGADQGGKPGTYAFATKIYSPYYAARFFGLVP